MRLMKLVKMTLGPECIESLDYMKEARATGLLGATSECVDNDFV